MLVESISITIISVVIIFGFLRSGKRQYAMYAAPLLIVPMANITYFAINEVAGQTVSDFSHMLIQIVALAASAVLIGIFANSQKTKRLRIAYATICGGYSTILTLIFLHNIYMG